MKKVRRLFEQFAPDHYALDLAADVEKMAFTGSVEIKGKKTGRPSQRITLHQKGLKIKSAKVYKHTKSGQEEVKLSRINLHSSYDELRLHSDELLYPGSYIIQLHFEGEITKPMHGLYPCYFEHDGKQKVLLATQFESHHAREVFPGIDEPEAKATFDLTLTTPAGEEVLSNTPVKEQKTTGNKLQTTFETSPRMSTYLLAFVTGEMHCVEAKTKDGVLMRTWGSVAQPQSFLNYSNDEGVKILDFFTDYFKTPFPLKKCDQVALPDFESGAMENWGLVTYREIALLADPVNRSQSSEQYVSMVVAHELSHQWFGNLVTMKWWDDLWLNESFASLMEHIALDDLHPDWSQWEQYTASDVLNTSSRDIFKDVQPVRVDVKHPDEIMTLFDPAIVYAKGGRLLKMLREYIGDNAFRAGLKEYFAEHAYGNTVRDDLWTEFTAASGKDINALMSPWLEQSGMPRLSVTHTKEAIELEQNRFVLDKDDDTSQWPIPLLASKKLETEILDKKAVSLGKPGNEPVIFNQNGSGHMLVHYTDQPTKDFIAGSYAKATLQPESRINILNDMFLLARKGDVSLTDSLDIVSQNAKEPRDAVWQIMSRAIGMSVGLTEGDEYMEAAVKVFRRDLAKDWYKKLGWDDHANDTANDKSLRQTILSVMVSGEDEDAVSEALRRYKAAKKVSDLPAEQRALIIGATVRAGEDVVDDLIKQYKSEHNPDVQLAICAGLASTKSPAVGRYIIKEALGEGGFVRQQDIFRWYAYFMRNRHTREFAWEWLKSSWDRLEKLFGDSKSFDYFVVFSAGPISTRDWQKEFVDFFTPKMSVVALERNIKIALSEIEARIAWRDREEPKIKSYFKSK